MKLLSGCVWMSQSPSRVRGRVWIALPGSSSLALGYSHPVPSGRKTVFQPEFGASLNGFERMRSQRARPLLAPLAGRVPLEPIHWNSAHLWQNIF